MKNRIHIQNSRRNHLLSLFLQFGTLSVKWISHIHLMDLSYSCVLFLHYSNLQLCQVDLKWSCTWKCNLLGYLSSQRPFFTLYLVFQGQNGCFRSNYRWKVNVFWPKLPHIKPLSCLSSSLQYFYQYLMDSFVLKSISRNHHLRICFMWSLWKFPVKLDRTRLTSVISANCLTAPPDSSASHASLLKQIPLGCEHIEEKRRSLQQRIR